MIRFQNYQLCQGLLLWNGKKCLQIRSFIHFTAKSIKRYPLYNVIWQKHFHQELASRLSPASSPNKIKKAGLFGRNIVEVAKSRDRHSHESDEKETESRNRRENLAKRKAKKLRELFYDEVNMQIQSGKIKTLLESIDQMLEDHMNCPDQHLNETLTKILCMMTTYEHTDYAESLFHRMLKYSVVNDETLSVIMQYKVKLHGWKKGLLLIKEMQEYGIQPNLSIYHPIILNALEKFEYDDALRLFIEMKLIKNIQTDYFHSKIIKICISHGNKSIHFMEHFLVFLMKSGFTVASHTKESLKQWFKTKSNNENIWKVEETKANERGICEACGTQLLPFSLPNHNLDEIKKDILNYSKNEVILIQDHNALKKFQSLAHHIDATGPYDIVVDILNIGYCHGKGFNPFQVKNTVLHFLNENKKVLVICGPPVEQWLLPKTSKATLPKEPHLIHVFKLLRFLARYCGVFFAGSNLVDDHFLIYAVAYSNFNIDLVSNDDFANHMNKIENIAASDMFRRWQEYHQLRLKYFIGGKPIFQERKIVNDVIQQNERSWHFPHAKGNNLLCCSFQSNNH